MIRFCFVIFCVFFLLSCSKNSADNKMREAEGLVGVGNYKAALSIYEKVAKSCPSTKNCAQSLMQIGDIEKNFNNNLERALESYHKVVEFFPLTEGSRIAMERIASIYVKNGDYNDAAETYAGLLQYFSESEKSSEYQLRLGEAYLALGNYNQARIDLKDLVKSESASPDIKAMALFAYAESFFLEGRLGLAQEAYAKLIHDYPDNPIVPEALMKIATCQEERGFLGDATETLLKLKKDYPNQQVVDDRIRALKKRGKANAAEEREKYIKLKAHENNSAVTKKK